MDSISRSRTLARNLSSDRLDLLDTDQATDQAAGQVTGKTHEISTLPADTMRMRRVGSAHSLLTTASLLSTPDTPIISRTAIRLPEEDKPSSNVEENIRNNIQKNIERIVEMSEEMYPPSMFGIQESFIDDIVTKSERMFNQLIASRRNKPEFERLVAIDRNFAIHVMDVSDKIQSELPLANALLKGLLGDSTTRIIFSGPQSSGKTSLMAALTGVKTKIGLGACTKQPIVYQFKGGQEFRAECWEETEPSKKKEFIRHEDFAKYMEESQKKIEATVYPAPLIANIQSPGCKRITLVDLPGDIQDDLSTEIGRIDAKNRKEINDKFLYHSKSDIVIRIAPHTEDLEKDANTVRFLKGQLRSPFTVFVLTRFPSFDNTQLDGYKKQDSSILKDGRVKLLSDKTAHSIAGFGVDVPKTLVQKISTAAIGSNEDIEGIWDEADQETLKQTISRVNNYGDNLDDYIPAESYVGLMPFYKTVSKMQFEINYQKLTIINNKCLNYLRYLAMGDNEVLSKEYDEFLSHFVLLSQHMSSLRLESSTRYAKAYTKYVENIKECLEKEESPFRYLSDKRSRVADVLSSTKYIEYESSDDAKVLSVKDLMSMNDSESVNPDNVAEISAEDEEIHFLAEKLVGFLTKLGNAAENAMQTFDAHSFNSELTHINIDKAISNLIKTESCRISQRLEKFVFDFSHKVVEVFFDRKFFELIERCGYPKGTAEGIKDRVFHKTHYRTEKQLDYAQSIDRNATSFDYAKKVFLCYHLLFEGFKFHGITELNKDAVNLLYHTHKHKLKLGAIFVGAVATAGATAASAVPIGATAAVGGGLLAVARTGIIPGTKPAAKSLINKGQKKSAKAFSKVVKMAVNAYKDDKQNVAEMTKKHQEILNYFLESVPTHNKKSLAAFASVAEEQLHVLSETIYRYFTNNIKANLVTKLQEDTLAELSKVCRIANLDLLTENSESSSVQSKLYFNKKLRDEIESLEQLLRTIP